jgi:fucose 4-O-acetylase-like acetyltransferase
MSKTMSNPLKERDYLFDNLKVVLIILVVLGHFCFMNRHIPSMMGITNMIYSFHMPLFIFISGYFSKSITSQRKADILNILIPYFIIEILNYIYTRLTGLGEGKLYPVLPTYQNWYLLALFFWRLLVPYANFFNRNLVIVIIVIIALVAGFIKEFGYFLASYRVVYFFPFFILGYYCRDLKAILDKFSRFRILFIIGFILLMAGIYVISIKSPRVAIKLHYAYLPNNGYDGQMQLMLLRAAGLLSSLLICFLLCYMVSSKQKWYSRYGQNTLYVFLFHMFLVWPVNFFFPVYRPGITEVFFLFSSLLITWILSTEVVTRILRPLIQPDSLFKRQPKPEQV